MAASGYTPISLYYSTTAAAQPVNTNLVNGELAINITDGKLYYKDNTNTVQLLASKNTTAGSVQSISVATANGLAGSSSGGTTPTLTLSTTVTGIVKGNGTSLSAAVSGTDYAPATSGASILYGNGSGGFSNVTIGSGVSFAGGTLSATGTGGTVTTVSVVSANGLAGTVANATTTPAITLSTSITGMLKGDGTAISAGTANTDYLVPALANTAVTGFKTATFNSQTTIATTSGSITVDWTTAQNQKQTEPTGTITYTFTAPPGVCHLQLVIDSDGTSAAQTINWPASVIWLGATWAGANNKKSVINFWYDGTNYFAIGSNQA